LLRCATGDVLIAGEGIADLVGELFIGRWVAPEVPGDAAEEGSGCFGAGDTVDCLGMRLVRCLWIWEGGGVHDISGVAAHLFHCE
jgi:hypothetical protein